MILSTKTKSRKWKIPGVEKNKIKVWAPYIREIQDQEKKEMDKELYEERIDDTKQSEQEKLESQLYEKNITEAEEKLNELKSEKHKLFLLLKKMIEEEEEKKKQEYLKQKIIEEREREEKMEKQIKQELESKFGSYTQDPSERYRIPLQVPIQGNETLFYNKNPQYYRQPQPTTFYNRGIESPKKREREPSPPYYHQNYSQFYERDQSREYNQKTQNPPPPVYQNQGFYQNRSGNNYNQRDRRYNNYYQK